MRNMLIIFRKELRIFFDSPIAYIFIIAFLAFSNWLFFRSFFIVGQISMRDYFFFIPWIFLVFVPAVTMRLWAEEKKIGTIEVLMTLPVRNYEVVLGKFLASFSFVMIALALSFLVFMAFIYYGEKTKPLMAPSGVSQKAAAPPAASAPAPVAAWTIQWSRSIRGMTRP